MEFRRRLVRLLLPATFLLTLFGYMVGCRSMSQTRQAEAKPAELVIGADLPMSGPTADWGRAAYRGAELAVEQLERKGIRLQLLPAEDNRGDASEAADAFRRLVAIHGAKAVVGPITSTNAESAARVADELKVPFVSPAATDWALTRDSAYAFRACFIDEFQGRILATFARTDLNASNAAIVLDSSDAYSAGLARVFQQTFTALGGRATELSIKMNEREFGPQISRIATSVKPDLVFVAANYPQVGAFVRQLRREGVTIPLLAGDGAHSPELFKLAGSAAEGVYVASHFAPDSSNATVHQFVQDYKQRFSESPNVAAALSYDSVLMVGYGFANMQPNESLRDAIASTKGLNGVTGTISLDSERNPIKSVVILKAVAGEFRFVKTVSP